jgi:SlyX protein
MQEESLEQIQSKIAYLERSIVELSDVVFLQHKEIRLLEAKLQAIRERLEGAQSDEARTVEQERPPHY